MITHITKNNRSQYVKLFTKAAEALKKEYPAVYGDEVYGEEGFSITTLEEYFQNLEEIASCDTKFLRLPVDEELFDIDLNTRQITVPPTFKKSGLGVQGDDLAEVVYFRTDRFFDATDLNETFILIQWEAPSGAKMASPAYFQEVDSETDKLIFGWAVTKEMTGAPGTLKFSVSFIDYEQISPEGDEIDISKIEYRLGTLASTISINAGLNLAKQGIIKFENRLDDLRKRIKNTPIYPESAGVAELAIILDYLGFKWTEDVVYKNIEESLIDDPTSKGEIETGLPLQAISPKAGIISYKWYKEGVVDSISDGLNAIRYVPVTYSDAEKKEEAVYFIKTDEGFRHFEAGTDWWMDPETEEINPSLFEKISFVDVNGPGVYYAEITNKEGMKLSTLTTPKAIVPAPVEIDSIVVNVEKDANGKDKEILKKDETFVLSSALVFSEDDPYGLVSDEDSKKWHCDVHYQWLKDGVEIEGANGPTHIAVEDGRYSLKAANHWNKAVSQEVLSSNSRPVYYEAIKPVITSFLPEQWWKEEFRYALNNQSLTVQFEEIDQQTAEQYIEWRWSDNDEDPNSIPDDPDVWETIKDAEGNPVRGNVLAKEYVQRAGDYVAVVHNYISDNNKVETVSDIIHVYIAN